MMRSLTRFAALLLALNFGWMAGCGGGGGSSQAPPPSLVAPTITVTPAANSITTAQDLNVAVSVTGPAGDPTPTGSVTLSSGSYSSAATTLSSGNANIKVPAGSLAAGTATLSAKYSPDTAANIYSTASGTTSVTVKTGSPITSITVSPNTATIGKQQQFAADVQGTGSFSTTVTWSVSCSSCGSLSPGSISSTGLYDTPYPAPATVVITATSTQDTTASGSVTVTLSAPATAAGPALTVDAANKTHAISPYIYGMNAFSLDPNVEKQVNLPVDRWGGDATSRYNYKLDVTNAASDWYFENGTGKTGQQDTSEFNQQVQNDLAVGAKTMGTVPVLGWVAKDGATCSFPSSDYPSQVGFDPYKASCGNGVYPQGVSGCTNAGGCNITGNDPTKTSVAVGPSWAGDWVTYLVSKFGKAADGGVAIYDLDNEPAWWDAVHRDVHSSPSSYDEVTNNGIATAKQIKNADRTAAVSGPVVDYWWNYFYSKKDIESGWGSGGGPCWKPWSNPVDRAAHGGVPFIEYYLQQFKAAETSYGARLLDYLDLHTYFAATYNGNGVGLAPAGDTTEQIARVDSTRVFWDPTYTDPSYPQPNYTTDANYRAGCDTPLQAPRLIPMAQKWVADNYPGTQIAFTEYNWGGQESINGAVAQADVLGIFGAYGLDLATLWGPPDPSKGQTPGLIAFEIYRNYDGKNAKFGDTSLQSTSADQGELSVYGAERASDGALTIVVINKTYGSLTSTLSLGNFTSSGTTAQAYQYSSADLTKIVAAPAVSITAPTGGSTTSTIAATFPAQSITLLVAPK
jgi:Glycoside hydrolase family 44/Bacterial Ig-like domain (group 3)